MSPKKENQIAARSKKPCQSSQFEKTKSTKTVGNRPFGKTGTRRAISINLMPTQPSELLQKLSNTIRISELRRALGNDLTPVLEQLYALWRSNRLIVKRDWGDPSLEVESVFYTNRACFLPSDCLHLVEATEQEQLIKIATWNLNSLRARMPLLLSWLEEHRPDIVCLQETKVEDALFPLQELALAGYQVVYLGQKSYNGVAILSKHPIDTVRYGFSNGYDFENKRVIAAQILGVWILNVYVPQGESIDSPKFSYKLQFLQELFQELEQNYDPDTPFLMVGDYNIAPDDRDVFKSRKAWRNRSVFISKNINFWIN